MKKFLFKYIRKFNLLFFKKNLPSKIGLYFHDIDETVMSDLIKIKIFFKDLGYEFVIPSQIKNDDSFQIYLSFDDNYFSWYYYSDQIKKININPTFYVNSLPFSANKDEINEYVKRIDYKSIYKPLSIDQLKHLIKLGFNIGSHTHSHFNISKLSDNELINEVNLNLKFLKKYFKKPIQDFSFPFGMPRFINKKNILLLNRMGFDKINYATPGLLHQQLEKNKIHRTPWKVEYSFQDNIDNLKIDGRIFVNLFNKSPIG